MWREPFGNPREAKLYSTWAAHAPVAHNMWKNKATSHAGGTAQQYNNGWLLASSRRLKHMNVY